MPFSQCISPVLCGQVNVTVPPNPSCEVREIGPFVPVVTALTSGNPFTFIPKSGLAVTTKLNEVVKGAAAPLVVACRVTGYVPAAVPPGTTTLAVMFTGDPDLGFTLDPMNSQNPGDTTWAELHAERSKGSAFRFSNFYFRPRGFGGSTGPEGSDETGAGVFSGASLAGNFADSFTTAAARSLLILHPGS